MIPATYRVFHNAAGLKYIMQEIDELDKNHQADSIDAANTAKMYKTPGKKPQIYKSAVKKTWHV